jgi:hypothetical protein
MRKHQAVNFVLKSLIFASAITGVVQLRDAVRAAILAGSGEPDLGELIKPPAAGRFLER